MSINKRKADPLACMVMGCERRALYRNASSSQKGSKRGYCGRHRDMAVSHAKQPDIDAERFPSALWTHPDRFRGGF